VRDRLRRLRPWLAPAGLLAAAAVLLPPAATSARHYVLAEAIQFAVLAVAAPALIVLGAPWRRPARPAPRPGPASRPDPVSRFRPAPRSRPESVAPSAVPAAPRRARGSLAERLATARSHRPAGIRPWLSLVAFLAAALAWRLPAAVDALVRHPALIAAEAITLLGAGIALWLELVDSPPLLPRASRPQRAAIAAFPMWAIWASAYVMGFSRTAWFPALARQAGRGLGIVADQQIAAFLLWAIPGIAFIPVVYVSLLTWLRDSADPDEELRATPGAARGSGPAAPRPPRGWRARA